MKLLRRALVIVAFLPFYAIAQQPWPHKTVVLNEIFTQWDGITKEYKPGMSVMQPQKVRFSAKYLAHPQPCSTSALQAIMNALGQSDFLKRAPISQCVRFASESGREVIAWVQDVLVPGFNADAKIDSQIEFYVDLLAYGVGGDRAKNMPYMLVGRFENK